MSRTHSRPTSRFVRDVLRPPDPPPPIPVRFFYTSHLVIDDPLSPLPPPQQQQQQQQQQQKHQHPQQSRSGGIWPNEQSTTTPGPKAVIQIQQPPRPFSEFDNELLEKAWLSLRRRVLESSERRREDSGISGRAKKEETRPFDRKDDKDREIGIPIRQARRGPTPGIDGKSSSGSNSYGKRKASANAGNQTFSDSPSRQANIESSRNSYTKATAAAENAISLTGTPFIRAPSRKQQPTFSSLSARLDSESSSKSYGQFQNISRPRPSSQTFSSFDEENGLAPPGSAGRDGMKFGDGEWVRSTDEVDNGLMEKVPVGVSRLHQVVMPHLQMEPIYWSPLNDVATVVRATWFYKDNMLPVEVEVANLLEAGYSSLRPWTMTWRDELNSAVSVGSEGEMKVLHPLWPKEQKTAARSRPGTARPSDGVSGFQNTISSEPTDPEKERECTIKDAGDLVDVSTAQTGIDNKASGLAPYGRDGYKRLYRTAGVIYANDKEAYILKPSLQPSAYYGRRPLANYIRRGRSIGIKVVRGFDDDAWARFHPPSQKTKAMAKISNASTIPSGSRPKSTTTKALEGVSTSQAGSARLPPAQRQKLDKSLAASQRPVVTDLVLVIHGIGQKLSERMESYHFTHAMNGFRREVNVELGTESVKTNLRPGMGGIMVLPVNWRLSLSFEEGGYRDNNAILDPTTNRFTLKDITPSTLPSVRNIISDVMFDVPYYLSQEYNPKMTAACIKEANRIYRLWCLNNPGFAEYGRVHLIAHSLGSVMAVDILSRQPTYVPPISTDKHHDDSKADIPPSTPTQSRPSRENLEKSNDDNYDQTIRSDRFLFNTTCLFTCGSPVGFFLLLKKASLLPRGDLRKPGIESCIDIGDMSTSASAMANINDVLAGVGGGVGTYGCLAVDNIYNIVNPYDPIAYQMNAAVDAAYAAALKPAYVPGGRLSSFGRLAGWFGFGENSGASKAASAKSPTTMRSGSNASTPTIDYRNLATRNTTNNTRNTITKGDSNDAYGQPLTTTASVNPVDVTFGLSRHSSSFNSQTSEAPPHRPSPPSHLPSTLELETHDFTREQFAEQRAFLLNDNGQVDYILRYGGGALDIQYLTMLGAHSSYWLSREFAGMVVVEVGRVPGREGTVPEMRAVKKIGGVVGGSGSGNGIDG